MCSFMPSFVCCAGCLPPHSKFTHPFLKAVEAVPTDDCRSGKADRHLTNWKPEEVAALVAFLASGEPVSCAVPSLRSPKRKQSHNGVPMEIDRKRMVIGFVGTGTNAEAVFTGLGKRGVRNTPIVLSPHSESAAARLTAASQNVVIHLRNRDILDRPDLVFVRVRPQIVEEVIRVLRFKPSVSTSSDLSRPRHSIRCSRGSISLFGCERYEGTTDLEFDFPEVERAA